MFCHCFTVNCLENLFAQQVDNRTVRLSVWVLLSASRETEEIVVRRINKLMSNGQILYRVDRYYINNPTMLFISKIIIVLKLLFLGKKVAG